MSLRSLYSSADRWFKFYRDNGRHQHCLLGGIDVEYGASSWAAMQEMHERRPFPFEIRKKMAEAIKLLFPQRTLEIEQRHRVIYGTAWKSSLTESTFIARFNNHEETTFEDILQIVELTEADETEEISQETFEELVLV